MGNQGAEVFPRLTFCKSLGGDFADKLRERSSDGNQKFQLKYDIAAYFPQRCEPPKEGSPCWHKQPYGSYGCHKKDESRLWATGTTNAIILALSNKSPSMWIASSYPFALEKWLRSKFWSQTAWFWFQLRSFLAVQPWPNHFTSLAFRLFFFPTIKWW